MGSSPSNEPNLDLIAMVQKARMMHDAEAVPSEVTANYWIEVKPDTAAKSPTERAGYWLIYVSPEAVDGLWAAIREATRTGQLGYKSKVSTAAHDESTDMRAVHVCTYDAADAADVSRVRNALSALHIQPERYVLQRDS